MNELRRQANEGLQARLKVIPHSATPEEYQERLDFELSIIEKMGFPGYFLIVADFIKWAKEHNIPVGPGRGSGAGSLVAYALTITDLDPLRYALLFERFLNPERVSMPDFDIDFCMDRREEVIRYVQKTGMAATRSPRSSPSGRFAVESRRARRRSRPADVLWPGRQAVEDDPGRRREAGLHHQGPRR